MIAFENVWHHHGMKPTLRGVSFEAEAGKLTCLMGENGVGKTTLLRIAAGVTPCVEGQVRIGGRVRRSTLEAEREIRREVAYLPAEAWLPGGNTAREFLHATGLLHAVPERRLMHHAEQLLRVFHLDGDQQITGCSTGQQKKVALAGAFVSDAPVLLLDEPLSGGLDTSGMLAAVRILEHLARESGRTVLMAVPVAELVERFADRVVLLASEGVVAEGTPAELLAMADAASLSEAVASLLHPGRGDEMRAYLAGEKA